jgi:hypothetical protein
MHVQHGRQIARRHARKDRPPAAPIAGHPSRRSAIIRLDTRSNPCTTAQRSRINCSMSGTFTSAGIPKRAVYILSSNNVMLARTRRELRHHPSAAGSVEDTFARTKARSLYEIRRHGRADVGTR